MMDAIVIVDVQKAFPVPPELVQRIVDRARDFPRRIFTQFVNPPGSLFRTKLKRTACPPGAEETELRIGNSPDDWVIQKTGYGLRSRDVEAIAAAGIKKVLVCGVDTDACVLGVAFSLFDGGVECEIDPELCWSSAGLQHAALHIIREQFGTACATAPAEH
jgi:nicotinamidase-related amidase